MAILSHADLHHFLAEYGYWAIALFVGLESMGIPLPGETILIIGAGYAATHDGSLTLVILSAAAGAIIGDNAGYLAGRFVGTKFLQHFGTKIGITPARIKLGQYLFMRYGGKVVFFGRFVAVLRFLAAFLAGTNRMPWPRFLIANAAGALVWATIVAVAAYSLGKGLHAIRGPIAAATFILAAAALAAAFLYLRRHEAAMQAEAEAALPGPIR